METSDLEEEMPPAEPANLPDNAPEEWKEQEHNSDAEQSNSRKSQKSGSSKSEKSEEEEEPFEIDLT